MMFEVGVGGGISVQRFAYSFHLVEVIEIQFVWIFHEIEAHFPEIIVKYKIILAGKGESVQCNACFTIWTTVICMFGD